MAKRDTGVGKNKKSRSHKTKKRLEIKRLMLEAKKNKGGKKKRPFLTSPISLPGSLKARPELG